MESHCVNMNDIKEDLETFQVCPFIIENKKKEKDVFMIEVHLGRHKSSTWVLDIGCGSHTCNNMQRLSEARKLELLH